MLNYVNDPLDPNYCPDPAVVSQEAMQTILTAIKDRICTDVNSVRNYTDSQVTEINNQVIAISNIEGLTEKMTQLNELLASVDINGDGVLDDLLQVKTVADQALALATESKSLSLEAKAQCVKVAQDLATAQTVINEAITNINVKVTAVENKVDANTVKINELVSTVDSIEGITEDTVASIVCDNNKRFWEGVAELATSMFAETCIQENEDPVADEDPLGV